MYQVDLNLLVGVMTFTFSPLHCFYATIVEGGAADRRRRPILVRSNIVLSSITVGLYSISAQNRYHMDEIRPSKIVLLLCGPGSMQGSHRPIPLMGNN